MFTFKSLPTKKQQITLPLLVILFASIALVANTESLTFNRELFSKGEFWRSFTGHFLHTNFNHYLLNVCGVILLWALHGQYYNKLNSPLLFIVSALSTSLGIYLYSPEITDYVGLSGILHGMFIWGAIKDIQHKDNTGYILLFAVVGKVIYEQIAGASESVAALISAHVAIDAHLWGMLGGAVVGIISFINAYCLNKQNKQ